MDRWIAAGRRAGRGITETALACTALAAAALSPILLRTADAQEARPPAAWRGPALLVVDMAGDRLVVIDPETRTVRARVATGPGPHEVAASADGSLAFVSNYGTREEAGRSISVIDLQAGRELRRVGIGALRRPHGLAVVEGKVYFTAEANRVLARFDPQTGEIDRVVGIGQDGTHMVVASPDGSTLFTADIGSGSVSALRRDTGRLTRLAVGGDPEGLATSPDGREVWAGQRNGGDVAVIDAKAMVVKATLKTGAGMAARLRFTPDGRRVLLPDPVGGRLLVIDATSREVSKAIDVGEGPVGAIIEPGGRRCFVPLAGAGRVAIVDLTTLAVAGMIDTGSVSDGIAWAAAGGPLEAGRVPSRP